MATGQSLLNLMELVNQELQLQSSEVDVPRGLIALNAAQDYLESRLSLFPNLLGNSTGTLTTTAATETTTFPTDVTRIDRLQLLSSVTSLPIYDMVNIRTTGGHAFRSQWPWSLLVSPTSAAPVKYYTNGTSIFWSPVPNQAYSVRWYGFQQQADITASGTVVYGTEFHLPMASFAAKLMKLGVGDDIGDLDNLAESTFASAIAASARFNRDRANGLEYSRVHDT